MALYNFVLANKTLDITICFPFSTVNTNQSVQISSLERNMVHSELYWNKCATYWMYRAKWEYQVRLWEALQQKDPLLFAYLSVLRIYL